MKLAAASNGRSQMCRHSPAHYSEHPKQSASDVEDEEKQHGVHGVRGDRREHLQAEGVANTPATFVLFVLLRLLERRVAELGHRIQPGPRGALDPLQLQKQKEGRDPARPNVQHAIAGAVPVTKAVPEKRTRAHLVEVLRPATVVREEAIALLLEQRAEIRRDVARRVAVGADKPAKRSSNARSISRTALRVRLLMELGPANRRLLQRERGAVRLLRQSHTSRATKPADPKTNC